MARTFRRQRVAHPIAELNITNLVDLAFVLLIVFMITVQVIREEQMIRVNLPQELKSPQNQPDPTVRVDTITVDANGDYFINGDRIAFPALQLTLRDFAAEPKPPIIRIAGDIVTQWGKVAAVMTELKKHPTADGTLMKLDIATETIP